MTITHLDDEPLDMLHPLDLLEKAVEANGWAFERAGRDELNLSVAGKWSDHHFNFSWRDDLQSLHLSSAFDMRISEGVRRQNVADLLMHVNAKLWIGHFDLWPQDGTIIFRHAMIFPDAETSAATDVPAAMEIIKAPACAKFANAPASPFSTCGLIATTQTEGLPFT